MESFLELKNDAFTDIYLLYCGMQECAPRYSFGPAIRDNYLLHYCAKGKGYYFVNNIQYTIRAGDAFLILPDVVTFYQADQEDPWTYYWIGFHGSKASLYLQRCGLDQEHLHIHCDEIEQLTSYIRDIMAHNTMSYANELYNQGILFQFFAHLSKCANLEYTAEVSSENIHVNKAIEYIQKNYQNPTRIHELADYIGLSRSYVSTLFQQHLHMSPQHFLLTYRLTRASKLLLASNLSINHIAYSCGYENQLAFSKAFHKQYQMSPSAFRKKMRLKTGNITIYKP